MGPVALLDKSAFQALSHREHLWLERYYFQNLAPVLVLELVGDLTKSYKDGRAPKEKAAELARKFLGSGPPVNVDYHRLMLQSLLGGNVPMQGKIIPDGAVTAPLPEGGYGMLVDVTSLNETIMRLQDGRTTELDELQSKLWRLVASGLNLNPLKEFINSKRIIVPRARDLAEALVVARGVADTGSLQVVWLQWLLGLFPFAEGAKAEILARWRTQGIALRTFAPYAHYCLCALLTLFVAWRDNLVRWQPTNLLDLQYLYYLPFCEVFSSDDRLHRALAPLLLQGNQEFLELKALKSSLRAIGDFFDGVPEDLRQAVNAVLGGYPPPRTGCSVYGSWLRRVGPWKIEAADRSKVDSGLFQRGLEYVLAHQ
jgi:hypothetical protein